MDFELFNTLLPWALLAVIIIIENTSLKGTVCGFFKRIEDKIDERIYQKEIKRTGGVIILDEAWRPMFEEMLKNKKKKNIGA